MSDDERRFRDCQVSIYVRIAAHYGERGHSGAFGFAEMYGWELTKAKKQAGRR